MLLRMIYDDKLAAAAYLIGCQRTGEAVIIDPERDVDRYEKAAAKEGLRITAATETHIHADFLSGLRELAEKGVRVYVSDEGDADWKYQWLEKKSSGGAYNATRLKDGDTFRVGNIEFKAVHTPGHTPEHVCFLVTDRGGGAGEPMGIATGDFVFVGDLGRPDLLETAAGQAGASEPSARRLFASVKKFASLPEWLQVWPAHGAGSACGKALGAVPQSTVGYEKRFSPAIRAAASEEGFVKYILDGQPEPPLYFARMKRLNKVGPPVLGGLPRPAAMGAAELGRIDTKKSALVDTRPWAAFKSGHVPGALSLIMNNSFSTEAGSMIGDEEDVYLIVEPGRVEDAVRELVRVGVDRIKGWFAPGAVEEFAAAGGRLAKVAEVSVAESGGLIEGRKPFLLDVRRAGEFAEGHAPGAKNIVHTRLLARLAEVPKDRPVLVNCRSGARSARACGLLLRHGFDATNLAGGFLAWEQAGKPVEK